ncbi:MAG: NAD(P)(+) transhydrogenase (Re/Si-specific) subunit beta [Clostridiaceae bacterium]|nr:NAD(P)(+) transhydrogenase (Re/Si-specific) subunit beta [Clostridiaceae bacterium]
MLYYIVSSILVLGILYGIHLMSKVDTARLGSALSSVCTAVAVVLTLYKYQLFTDFSLHIFLAIGLVLGLMGAKAVKMIEMPQTVALLNGFGGLASALVAVISIDSAGTGNSFAVFTAALAIAVGFITFSGSMVAGAKLHKLLSQKPTIFKLHNVITSLCIVLTLLSIVFVRTSVWGVVIFSTLFGIFFSIRVGGADMPITISLLNSLSGVAGSIAGIAIYDPLLTAVGAIVGASGLILTQIMCKAMNRKLIEILLGKTTTVTNKTEKAEIQTQTVQPEVSIEHVIKNAKKTIIVPGYGMALSQAQSLVKELEERLENNGSQVKYAIHPVAGRMPGHMNVLLCEVDVPYERLFEMDSINDEFSDTDLVIVIGANDVVNPAANTAEGTPIYGMPILKAEDAKHIIVCNFDTKPGYAGVDNPLYNNPKTIMLTGDAKETVQSLIDIFKLN